MPPAFDLRGTWVGRRWGCLLPAAARRRLGHMGWAAQLRIPPWDQLHECLPRKCFIRRYDTLLATGLTFLAVRAIIREH